MFATVIRNFLIGILIGYLAGSLFLSCTANASTTQPVEKVAIIIAAETSGENNHIDPLLILAVIEVESQYNIYQTGFHGEIGLMQLMPVYFPDAPYDIFRNVELGTKHLVEMRKRCPVKRDMTFVICYNQGTHRVPKYPKLHPYYKKVMNAYKNIQAQEGKSGGR